jgi:hypothetical protein
MSIQDKIDKSDEDDSNVVKLCKENITVKELMEQKLIAENLMRVALSEIMRDFKNKTGYDISYIDPLVCEVSSVSGRYIVLDTVKVDIYNDIFG